MNAIILVNGADVTDACLLSATKITADSSKRITTASITIMGQAVNKIARYDSAHYGEDVYSLDLRELYLVTILDGRDGVTKLFEGRIFSFTLVQSDAASFGVFYQCELNDYAAWLDRSVCWQDIGLAMPSSDKAIIQTLLAAFCPQIDATLDVAALVPVIQKYDYKGKTCRQVLDDMATLSAGEWHVDFDGELHYGPTSAAPLAPFDLSTSPDMVMSFPVNVSGYRHDFNNPVNRAYVRGSIDAASGVAIEASYSDPISVGKYGEYAYSIVDAQILTGWDASLRAKSLVLKYAYPIESGTFTIWAKDGLALGQQVHIVEENLGIDGTYIIRQLSMQWIDQYDVQYVAQFGASQPDLETVLRLMAQRASWASSLGSTGTSVPAPGSVSDASIVSGGLSANVINSVNANTILGKVNASQISSVNAGAILGQVNASQIATVNAGAIQGVVQASQIGSVNATTIQGVIISDQLANGIIDNLDKYVTALRPVQMVKTGPFPPTPWPHPDFPPGTIFYYVPDGHFYEVQSDYGWHINDSPQNALMNFYHIGALNAQSIIGLILAAQIQSITAGQITGQIQAGQIGGVNASSINGSIQASQIATVNAGAIQGTIDASHIGGVAAGNITGKITATQIDTISASQISGTIQGTQINNINATTITIGQLVDSQIAGMSGAKLNVGSVSMDKFPGFAIDVGGLANMPGRIRVFTGGNAVVAQMGILSEVGIGAYGGWFQLFGAGGTSYANAPIYTDAAGNLYIRSPNFSGANLSGGTITDPTFAISGQIKTSPSQFDPTYGSLALVNEQSPDKASFVSRGLVLYYNNSKVGSVVRAPGGGWMEIECPGSGYVLINSGNTGVVRADGGFGVGGAAGVTGTFHSQEGRLITVTKGIVTGIA